MTSRRPANAMLERLKALSDDRFQSRLDKIDRGQVGALQHRRERLRQIIDMTFGKGEYAD